MHPCSYIEALSAAHRADKQIQQASAEAAVYQAKAIAERGMAEAKVLCAKYGSEHGYKEIQLAEINRDVQLALYKNLPNFNVQMPRVSF